MFAQGPVDSPVPEGPLLARGLSLRFFAVAPRFESAGRDTAILIRETPLARDGSIRAEGLPADVPMFEQLVDAGRHPVMTTHGPAHVAGLNWGSSGATVRCVGCHLGHSTLSAGGASGAADSLWVNASPSAQVTASSAATGTAGPRAAVDRRTWGPTGQVAWVAKGSAGESLRLSWAAPLRVREVVLYGPRAEPTRGTHLTIERCELELFRDGAVVARLAGLGPISPAGTRILVGSRVLDAIEIRIEKVRGTAAHRRAAALAEVETIARPAEPAADRATPE